LGFSLSKGLFVIIRQRKEGARDLLDGLLGLSFLLLIFEKRLFTFLSKRKAEEGVLVLGFWMLACLL
jgi:hypothetical protein